MIMKANLAANETATAITPALVFGAETPTPAHAPYASTRLDRDRLLAEHITTVRFVARSVHERLPQHIELEELVSAGMIGLVDAVNKFDPAKQVQFKSYAQFRIRGAILDLLRSLDWSPRELRRRGRAMADAVQHATTRLGRVPTQAEVAAEMGLDLQSYQQLAGDLKSLEIASLHAERGEEGGEDEIAYLPTPITDDPLFQCLEEEKRQLLASAIDNLPEKERLVLTLYYHEELTMKEIGLTLGVVESRVSQIHSNAVSRLRGVLGVSKAGKQTRQRRAA